MARKVLFMSDSLKDFPSSEGGVISTEVTPSPTKKRYTTAFKLHILEAASQCTAPGEIASMLRREGIYFPTLSDFRKQKARGLLDTSRTKRERKDQANCTLLRDFSASKRENRKLRRELAQTRALLDLQKNSLRYPGVGSGTHGVDMAALLHQIEKAASKVSIAKACRALEVSPATYYRSRHPSLITPAPSCRGQARALTSKEKQRVLSELHSERFQDKAAPQVFTTLLDEGVNGENGRR